MSKKKLGFGLMRLPSLDPNDPSKIDIEQTKKMVDGSFGCIVDLIAKMRLKRH